jgi:hypothetical protein
MNRESPVGAPESAGRQAEPEARGWAARLRGELRRHAIGYGVLLAFVLLGPLLVHLIFPEAPLGLGVVGGFAFGVYAAVSAVPDRFFE